MYIAPHQAPGDLNPSRGCFVKIEFVCSTKCYGFELVLSGQFNFLKIDTINIKFSSSKLHNDDKKMEYFYCHCFLKFILVSCCTGSSTPNTTSLKRLRLWKLLNLPLFTFSYLWLPLVTRGYLSLPFLTFSCLFLPFFMFPYFSLPYFEFTYRLTNLLT